MHQFKVVSRSISEDCTEQGLHFPTAFFLYACCGIHQDKWKLKSSYRVTTEDVAHANHCLTLWRAGWARSRSDTAPGVAACPLALELRDLLLPLHPGPDAQRQGRSQTKQT